MGNTLCEAQVMHRSMDPVSCNVNRRSDDWVWMGWAQLPRTSAHANVEQPQLLLLTTKANEGAVNLPTDHFRY